MAADTKFQHKVYMLVVAVVNLGFIVNGILFPLRVMNIIVVGLPHFRDLLYIVLRIFFSRCKFVRSSTKMPDRYSSSRKNVVAIIPAYKEDPEEVELTLKSIGEQEEDDLRIAMVIVSDGFLDYHEIIDDLKELVAFDYTTYKRDKNSCSILVGYYKGMKVVVAKKAKNAGKKDSLVVTDDIFVEHKFLKVRNMILEEFDMESCDFLFHTDADSVIGPNSFRRLTNVLLNNEKIAAVAGLVLVPFEGFSTIGFWNLFQGFQYYYGQVIRKATESLWGKITCLPGCITMVRAQHPAIVAACDRYNKLPSSSFIFQVKNRLQGTDRRYTNCVAQYSRDTYLVVDMRSDCFTVPPQSMEHFRSQRKRWTSNAITGNWFLIMGSNVRWYTRVLCSVDIFRIHTSVTRFACTVQFFFALFGGGTEVTIFQISMLVLVLALPYIFFLSTLIGRGRYGMFLFVGSLVSKMFSPFITIYIFLYAMWNFNDLNWGKTHGSQPTEAAKSVDKEKPDLEESSTGLEDSVTGMEDSTTEVEESTTACGEALYDLESNNNRCQNLLMRWDSFESEEFDPLPPADDESEGFYDINLDDEADRNGISVPLLNGEIV